MSDGIISLRAYKLRSPGHIKMSFGPAAISDLRLPGTGTYLQISRDRVGAHKLSKPPMCPRKLPPLRDKQEVELSGRILAGGSNEEIEIYGKSDCWDIEGSR